MDAIEILEYEHFLLRFGWGGGDACVDWAVTRLGNDDEGDDLEIVLLASARGREEVLLLVEVILERLVDEYVAGKYIAALRTAYLKSEETVESLDMKFSSIYPKLGYPDWLVMLSRNCEYALDIPAFEEPFENEFEYVANLWAAARSLPAFNASCSRESRICMMPFTGN